MADFTIPTLGGLNQPGAFNDHGGSRCSSRGSVSSGTPYPASQSYGKFDKKKNEMQMFMFSLLYS